MERQGANAKNAFYRRAAVHREEYAAERAAYRFTAYGTLRDVFYREQEDASKLELPYICAEYADWGGE